LASFSRSDHNSAKSWRLVTGILFFAPQIEKTGRGG